MPRFELTRRQVLKGLLGGGAACLALPVLEGMLGSSGTKYADGKALPRRFGVWFWGVGVRLDRWVPGAQGVGYPASPELQPLFDAGVSEYVSVVSGMNDPFSTVLAHHDGWVSMLTGSNERMPADRPGNGLFTHPTLDQIVARQWKGQAACDSIPILVSRMGPGQNAAYGVGISQKGHGQVNRGISSPAELFRLLFGDPSLSAAQAARAGGARQSLLDAFLEDAHSLEARLGTADRARVDEYMEDVRSVERRIQRGALACERPSPPVEPKDGLGHEDLAGRGRLLADLLVLALRCDLTRVFSFEFTPMQAMTVFWQVGSAANYHALTHQGDRETAHRAVVFTMGELAYLLAKLKATREGHGNLLDRSCIYATSEVAEGSSHSRRDMPILVAGRAGGALRSGVHYRSTSGESPTKVPLTLMQALGLPVKSFGMGEGATTETVGALRNA